MDTILSKRGYRLCLCALPLWQELLVCKMDMCSWNTEMEVKEGSKG